MIILYIFLFIALNIAGGATKNDNDAEYLYGGLNVPDNDNDEIWDFFGDNRQKQEKKKREVPIECQETEVIKKVESKLTNCEAQQQKLQDQLKEMPLPKRQDSNLPYFKHLLEKLTSLMVPNPEDPGTLIFQGQITVGEYELLKGTLKEANPSNKLLLDLFVVLKPSTSWKVYASQLAWPILISGIASVIALLILLYAQFRFYTNASTMKHVLWMLFFAFVVSIPWEWYRLYNTALAKKAASAMKDIPAHCSLKQLTVWTSVKVWFRDMFTLSDDECIQYHQNLLVDPIWEVSPLQAAAVSSSRLFTEFAREFSSAIGASFKLFLRELPAQWQPIALILFLLLIALIIIVFGGVEISLPFTKIGVGRNRDFEIQQLKDKCDNLVLQIENSKRDTQRPIEIRLQNTPPLCYEDKVENIAARDAITNAENEVVNSDPVEKIIDKPDVACKENTFRKDKFMREQFAHGCRQDKNGGSSSLSNPENVTNSNRETRRMNSEPTEHDEHTNEYPFIEEIPNNTRVTPRQTPVEMSDPLAELLDDREHTGEGYVHITKNFR